MRRLIIFDFDGTMTDAEREGVPFRQGYLEDLAILTGRPLAEIVLLAERFEAEVAADRNAYGWMFGGRIVAPAGVDPYLRIMPVARKILDACGAFASEADRARLLDGILYKYNYQKTVVAFREGALKLLTTLGRRGTDDVYVVTNSHTEPVQNKIRMLGQQTNGVNQLDWLIGHVHGSARKYVIDDGYERVPAELTVPGLERPVLLRRRHYAEALEALRERCGLSFEQVWVVGDIFELDLALPYQLGANVVLVANAFTPPYEQEFLRGRERGHVVGSLTEVLSLLLASGGS